MTGKQGIDESYGVINHQEQIDYYRNIVVTKAFLRNSLFFLMLAVYTIPIAIFFWYVLRGIEEGKAKRVLFGLTVFRLAHFFGYLAIIFSIQFIAPAGDSPLMFFVVLIIFMALYIWHTLMSPVVKGLRDGLRYINKKYDQSLIIEESGGFFSNAFSVFRGSKFKQPAIISKMMSMLLYFASSFADVIAILIVFLAPVLVMFQARRLQGVAGQNYEFSSMSVEASYEYIIYSGTYMLSVIPILLLTTLIVSFTASRFRLLGDYFNRRNIDEYRLIDDRNPILFLRSFKDKKAKFGKIKGSMLFHSFTQANRIRNLDNMLVDKFWNIGPVYALANPRGELNSSGSIKQQISGTDNNWQTKILELMENAVVIIIAMAGSESLNWEIDQVNRNRHQEKSIFIFRDKASINQDTLSKMKDLTPSQVKGVLNGSVKAIYYRDNIPIAIQSNTNDPITYLYIISHCITACVKRKH